MTEIVAADIGGTHARFAIAEVEHGQVVRLDEAVTLSTAAYPGLRIAWSEFKRGLDRPLPNSAAIAVAAPVANETIRFTNSSWEIRPAELADALNLERHLLMNDFEAVGHAVGQCGPEWFEPLSGPVAPLGEGTVTIVGPGTGLGVAQLYRDESGYRVQATEGGHVDFAPLDAIEDAMLARLRDRHGRVSVERLVSGPGIVEIHATFAGIGGNSDPLPKDKDLWALALAGEDPWAICALDQFCMMLGSVAGDIALAQGGFAGVVIAGGLGLRLKDKLPQSGFAERFRGKGRFESLMASIPVKLITHPQPGLFGAAAAFAKEHP